MFLLHEYDIFWTFLIIASLIPILAFLISGYQPTLSTEMGSLQERIASTKKGSLAKQVEDLSNLVILYHGLEKRI